MHLFVPLSNLRVFHNSISFAETAHSVRKGELWKYLLPLLRA